MRTAAGASVARVRGLIALCIAVVAIRASAQGHRFRDGTPHFWPEGAVPPPGTELEPPGELGGLRFGESIADARRRCRMAGHRWQTRDEARATCTGTARDLTFAATLDVRFCQSRVCELRASFDGTTVTDRSEFRPWALAYGSILRVLRGAFGDEVSARVRAPEPCQDQLARGQSATCFLDRDHTARHYWVAGGFEVLLSLTAGEEAPRLELTMRAPARVAELSATSD